MGPLNCVVCGNNGGTGQNEVSGYILQANRFKRGGGGVKDKSFKDDFDLDAVDVMGEVIFSLLAP